MDSVWKTDENYRLASIGVGVYFEINLYVFHTFLKSYRAHSDNLN
jgi:hypothetical protein